MCEPASLALVCLFLVCAVLRLVLGPGSDEWVWVCCAMCWALSYGLTLIERVFLKG